MRFSRDGDPVYHCHSVFSFAEHTLVTKQVVVGVTDALPPEQTTLLGCGVFTGVGAATNTADIESGSSVVFGAGSIGLSTIQSARMWGTTEIVCVDVVPEKLLVAEEVGATHVVDATEADLVKHVRDRYDSGVDYAFEVVGVPLTGPQALELDPYDLVGSFNGSYTLLLAIPRRRGFLLNPMISDAKPLDELNEAMANLKTGKASDRSSPHRRRCRVITRFRRLNFPQISRFRVYHAVNVR